VEAAVAARVNEIGYLGLGSNVGDRRTNLQACVEMLWAHDVVVLLSSSVYETEPVGEVLEQRPFYNACVRVETRLGPLGLLDACKAVEDAFGRVQMGEDGYVRHGPRAIDLDVLLLGESVFESERLTLPHREVTTRRFVLVPLLELDPWLEVPGRGLASDWLERIEGQDVHRAGPPLEVGP
jgi:2-amino-4-hydroxy-6-hydroxymethyldihydropteridine diphosphokinase